MQENLQGFSQKCSKELLMFFNTSISKELNPIDLLISCTERGLKIVKLLVGNQIPQKPSENFGAWGGPSRMVQKGRIFLQDNFLLCNGAL